MNTSPDNYPPTSETPVDGGWRDIILCLLDWLKQNGPSDQKAHKVLWTLATESLKAARVRNEDGQRQFTAKDIADAAGEVSWGDSKGLNWSKDVEPYWKAKRADIIQFAVQQGLPTYPEVKRHSTPGRHKATFEIIAVPIPENRLQDPTAASPGSIIQYTRSQPGEVKLAWSTRPFFRKGEFWLVGWRRWLILAWFIGTILGATLLVFLIFWGLVGPTPINTSHIAALIIIFGLPVALWTEVLGPWLRLFDDRIIPAPDLLLAVGAEAAQMEVYRENDLRVIRFVRYSATCSFCSASVYLDDGAPDFPRRLVGRCSESPREHVFSFDRVSQRGEILRRPPSA
jgi:hypothetical protein